MGAGSIAPPMTPRSVRPALFGLLAFLGLALSAVPAAAQQACGHQLSPPVMGKWLETGGEHGSLGCPANDETVTSTSQAGTKARGSRTSPAE